MGRKKLDKLVPASTGKPRMYQGTVPAESEGNWKASPELARIESKLGPRLSRFIALAVKHGDQAKAARHLNPELSSNAANKRGYQYMKQCRERLTMEEMDAVFGLFRSKIVSTIAGGMNAMHKKTFVLPRTGEIVESPPEPDWANRLRAAELGAKVLKLNDESSQQITVNLIQYAPKNAPRWPGADDEILDITQVEDHRND